MNRSSSRVWLGMLGLIILTLFSFASDSFRQRVANSTLSSKEQPRIFAVGTPTKWNEDATILLVRGNNIIEHDLIASKSKELFVAKDSNSMIKAKWTCFGKNLWRLGFSNGELIEIELQNGKITNNKKGMFSVPNHHDCLQPNSVKYIPNSKNNYLSASNLLSNADYNADILEKLISQLDVDSARYTSIIRSTYDKKKKKYFWYMDSETFDVEDQVWPIQGWWIDLKDNSVEKVTIPIGPWVTKYGIIDDIKSFACGPQCYTNMKIYALDKEIYIHIFGSAVKHKVEGFYRLRQREIVNSSKWEKLVNGQISTPIFSPNGCLIAYEKSNIAYITNLCIPNNN